MQMLTQMRMPMQMQMQMQMQTVMTPAHKPAFVDKRTAPIWVPFVVYTSLAGRSF
jgi:hypothetical protein